MNSGHFASICALLPNTHPMKLSLVQFQCEVFEEEISIRKEKSEDDFSHVFEFSLCHILISRVNSILLDDYIMRRSSKSAQSFDIASLKKISLT